MIIFTVRMLHEPTNYHQLQNNDNLRRGMSDVNISHHCQEAKNIHETSQVDISCQSLSHRYVSFPYLFFFTNNFFLM